MKKRRVWSITPPVLILGTALLLAVGVTYFLNRIVFFAELGLTVSVIAVAFGWMIYTRRGIHSTLLSVAESLDQTSKDSLSSSPLPVVVCSEQGEILWYNVIFQNEVLENNAVYGESLSVITGGPNAADLSKKKFVDVSYGSRRYTAYISKVTSDDTALYVLYYIENTRYKKVFEEYMLSRPSVVLIYIDNMDELLQNARESERAQISGKVETLLEDWTSKTSGLLRRLASDRFLLIVEQRHLQQIILQKFDILDKVRSVQTGANISVTLSIGVGQGATLRESEQLARQAIDMALGRGGDQAAVKTKNGFDFYGGVSRGIERRTKVRTRVVASALQELIESSDNVLVMGHRFSDLDCLGAATALASCIRGLGKCANVVVKQSQSLTPELIKRYIDSGFGDLFLEPDDALLNISGKTLLIITDTHNPNLVESEEILQAAETVVVIDHHRKMVDHIDNAVIFFHEPYASSASEMVAEMLQYIDGINMSRLDAESLLAGIMLDTRSFVFKAGVRTFEAAAYLRRLGADTVEVKRMFSGSIETYKEKADIVAETQMYKQAAIAVDRSGLGGQLRIAAAQAADEMLYIKGVEASFVLFADEDSVNISARSLGDFNVQLVMEAMGGGGHLTMAGARLANTTLEQAYNSLIEVIDRYKQDQHSRALSLKNAY